MEVSSAVCSRKLPTQQAIVIDKCAAETVRASAAPITFFWLYNHFDAVHPVESFHSIAVVAVTQA